MKKCVFAGTFDPPTTGHTQVIENCLKIFDETVVAVMVNHDIRNTVDSEYENRNNFSTKKLKPDLIPIYFPAGQESLHISSTLVKNLYKFKKDFSQYVPEQISADVLKILNAKEK